MKWLKTAGGDLVNTVFIREIVFNPKRMTIMASAVDCHWMLCDVATNAHAEEIIEHAFQLLSNPDGALIDFAVLEKAFADA